MSGPELVMWICDICQTRNSPVSTECSEIASHPVADRPIARLRQAVPAPFAEVLRSMAGDRAKLTSTLAAARDAGWTLKALSVALGCSHEQARLLANEGWPRTDLPAIPDPPRREPAAKPQRVRLEPTPEVADKLRAMFKVAATVTGFLPVDHPSRATSVEFTALLQALVEEGVTVYRLAKILGIYHTGIYMRLARHGYREPVPSAKDKQYRGVQIDPTEAARARGGAR